MPRKGENIYKRKDGRWEGRYIKEREKNEKIHYGYLYGKSYKEVKTKMAEISAIQTKKEEMARKEQVTFDRLAEDWLQNKSLFFKESTRVRYQNLLKLYILPEFGKCAPEQLTYARICTFHTGLLLNGGSCKKGLSSKTVSDILSLLYSIFRYAERKDIYIPAGNVTISVKQEKKQIRVLSPDEQKKLCDYLGKEQRLLNLGILLCLFTGLRIGEICALTWKDISAEEQCIYVHKTMQRLQTNEQDGQKTYILISAPKSSCSIRKIPVPGEIFERLESVRSLPEAYFLTGVSSKYVEPRTLQYQFKRILEKCGVEDANFHALRHTFATRCVEVGFDIKSLSEILGHANVNITLNRYVHPSMDLKRENMNKLVEFFAVK
ncbi:MAG: site-specific integrase [Lachnospiraceae bacterium]|nr:site-specific integrase [Lachnospiraceae bacterium]